MFSMVVSFLNVLLLYLLVGFLQKKLLMERINNLKLNNAFNVSLKILHKLYWVCLVEHCLRTKLIEREVTTHCDCSRQRFDMKWNGYDLSSLLFIQCCAPPSGERTSFVRVFSVLLLFFVWILLKLNWWKNSELVVLIYVCSINIKYTLGLCHFANVCFYFSFPMKGRFSLCVHLFWTIVIEWS